MDLSSEFFFFFWAEGTKKCPAPLPVSADGAHRYAHGLKENAGAESADGEIRKEKKILETDTLAFKVV